MKRIFSWRRTSSSTRPNEPISIKETVKLACKPKHAIPEQKYMDAIIAATWSRDDTLHDMFMALSPCLHGDNYFVVLKALTVLHTMIRNGATHNVLTQLSQSDSLKLRDVYSGTGDTKKPDILRNYARYIDRRARAYRDLKHDMIQIRYERDPDMLGSVIERREHNLEVVEVTKELLRETKAVHQMIDALVECNLLFDGTDDVLGSKALQMIVRDLVVLFQIGNEAIMALLEQYFVLSKKDAAAVLQIYQYFCEQTEYVTDYLAIAKKLPALRTVRIPNFRHAPLSLADPLQMWLNDPYFEQNRLEYQANMTAVEVNQTEHSTAAPHSSNSPLAVVATTDGRGVEDDSAPDDGIKEVRRDEELLRSSSNQATDPQLSTHDRTLRSLLGVLRTPEKTKAMRELKGERAQAVIDFLYSVLVQLDPALSSFRKHTIIALYKLSKSSQLYPQHYVLQDISLETVEDGGGFCDIHRGRHQDQDLCLKVVRIFQKKDTDAILKLFAKEAILWGQLVHPNVLPFYGVYYLDEARRRICLISPWMENGNIVGYLNRNPSVPRTPLIVDIVNGLGYLHKENVIHGDLKGVNVLVTDSGRACIADFGLSSIFTDTTIGHTISKTDPIGATYRWAAPELLNDSNSLPSYASDIWAFGCVCYQVLTRMVPFHEVSSDGQVIGKIMRGGLPTRPEENYSVPDVDKIKDEMWDLMTQCWEMDPQLRPTCQQIFQNFKLEEYIDGRGERVDECSAYDSTRFLDAMRKKADVSVDLAQIEQILQEL